MFCKAKPYEGKEPYIFFSYCHKDAEMVYPVIERLAAEGFRIWYDNGIHPGDNWIETIASHLDYADICIAAVTKNSVLSHNCRNEINFSLENNKKFIPIVFENFVMSVGVRLQISSSQYIKKYEQPNEMTFYNKLYEIDGIKKCQGKVSFLKDSEKEDYKYGVEKEEKKREESLKKAKEMLDFVNHMPDIKVTLGEEPEEKKIEVKEISKREEPEEKKAEIKEPPKREESEVKKPEMKKIPKQVISKVEKSSKISANTNVEENCITIQEEDVKTVQDAKQHVDFYYDDDNEDERTVLEDRTVLIDRGNRKNRKPGKTAEPERKAVFVRCSTQEFYPLKKTNVQIGRDENRCDIVIGEDTISSLHATIFRKAQECYIRDADSRNGTVLNDIELEGMQPVQLKQCELIYLADEMCMFAMDELAEFIMEKQQYALLQCEETDEIKLLTLECMHLGRLSAWEKGTFSDKRTSRNHGAIYQEDGKYILEIAPKETANGTFCNGQRLDPGDRIELSDGDEIAIGKVYHIKFYCISLNEGGR